jgi:hypothetical protein
MVETSEELVSSKQCHRNGAVVAGIAFVEGGPLW